jgi:Holliday junction resolvase RusA-like endonuclease
MSQVRVTAEQVRAIMGKSRGARNAKPFTLADTRPRKKTKSAAEWLAQFRATPRPAESPKTIEQAKSLFELHDVVTYRLWLPLAPSNNALKQIRKAHGDAWLAPTAAAEAYPIAVAEAWSRHWHGKLPDPLTGRLRVRVIVHPARRGSDIANREKALSDALTDCGCWRDDGLIDDIHLIRGAIVPETGAMDVIVEVISP